MNLRGTGRTTEILKSLPEGGVFIWCTSDISYPKALCRYINRTDIRVEPASTFKYLHRLYGRKLTGLEIDHALLDLCDHRWDHFEDYLELKERIGK